MFGVNLNYLVAREHQRELLRAAKRSPEDLARATPVTRVTLRYAGAADRSRLSELAALDSALPPNGAVLVAEIDGRLRAALPLDGSEPIADPFDRGAELIDLLRLRAAQLGRA